MARKKPNPEQTELPGAESVQNDAVHKQALVYARHRDERMKASIKEKENKELLIGTMKEEGLVSYCHGGVDVTLTEKDEIKVLIGGQKPQKRKKGADD